MHDDLKKAVEVLKSGGIILYPTDTIWGIGCDATDTEAVKRIYELSKINAAVRFVSVEPMLQKIQLPLRYHSHGIQGHKRKVARKPHRDDLPCSN